MKGDFISKDASSYICPVCGYDGLEELPYNEYGNPSYEICHCCGFEYGFDDLDQGYSFKKYREDWIEDGKKWFSPENKPDNWNYNSQIEKIRIASPFLKMSIPEIEDEIDKLMNIDYSTLNKYDEKITKLHLENFYEALTFKLEEKDYNGQE